MNYKPLPIRPRFARTNLRRIVSSRPTIQYSLPIPIKSIIDQRIEVQISIDMNLQVVYCSNGLDTLCPFQAKCCLSLHQRLEHIWTENLLGKRDRRCGLPHYSLLLRARLAADDPDDPPAFDGLKVFPSLMR